MNVQTLHKIYAGERLNLSQFTMQKQLLSQHGPVCPSATPLAQHVGWRCLGGLVERSGT